MIQTPPTPRKLPGLIDSTHLFTMLFGADTTCKSRKTALLPQECEIVAFYRDNQGKIRRLLVCDLAFANSAGAALSAIPPGPAKAATKAGQLSDNILENLFEVMNVAVNLFTDTFGGRLELEGMVRMADISPSAQAALQSDQRAKIEIEIPRYDVGRVDLIAYSGG